MAIEDQLTQNGFCIINDIFTESETDNLVSAISNSYISEENSLKSSELFAIRQFFKEIPHIKNLIFTYHLKSIIRPLFNTDYFAVKSIYFDKPQQSNWFVAYHQDLTISVDKKVELEGYNRWTTKNNQFAVQPPIHILESIYTLRIHLDDTNEENGALKVIPGSHLKGIYRPETINWKNETELTCNVKKGGVMIMSPLLLHSSSRTTNSKPRRVIHIELSNKNLHSSLNWSEKTLIY